jgi:hypothetical protein
MITGPLADALKRGRQSFNARFVAAKPIDAAAFQAHLTDTLDPIVQAVAAKFPERTDAVVEALYDLSLDLFRQNLLGPQAKYPVIVEAWKIFLPAIPTLVAREPNRIAASITNVLYNLATTPGARPNDWLKLAAASPDFNLSLAALLAWQCGLPQYRESVLDKAPELAHLRTNPWNLNNPNPSLQLLAKAGAFRGFAGQFLRPPRVDTLAGAILATDGDSTWQLHADLYNAILLRVDRTLPPPLPLKGDAQISANGTVNWKGQRRRFPELASSTSIAAISHTLAVTLATSHHLYLLGLA